MKSLMFMLVMMLSLTAVAGKGVISGAVKDASSGKAIEYATIMVYLAIDSSLISGGHSDSLGQFEVSALPEKEELYVVIRSIGYEEVLIPNLKLQSSEYEMGNIQLKPSYKELGGVSVTAEKSMVEQHVDKKVYNADQMNASGNTALDLLREIPSVLVDENDQITFRGQSGITILVSGRPLNMSPSQYLRSISANQVEKIEVISNPSAKYDAEGMSGIINVLLKKNRNKGFNGSASLMYGRGVNNRLNGSLDLAFHTEKWNFFASYFFNDYKKSHESYTMRELLDGEEVTDRLISEGTSMSGSFAQIIRAGADFFPNEKNTLYVAGTYNPGNILSPSQITYTNSFTGLNSYRETDGYGPKDYYDVNFGWQSTLGKKLKLDFDTQYSLNDHTTFEYITELFENGSSIETNTYGLERNWNFISRLDFEYPITDSLGAEFGIKYNNRLQDSYLEMSTLVNEAPTDSGFISQFSYNQSVAAAYVSFEKTWPKWGAKLGLRAEQTNTFAQMPLDAYDFENNYFSLFPTGFVNYKVSKLTNLYYNFGRRISRPLIHMVNPFVYYSDRYLVEQGTPNLRPEFVYNNELGISRYTKKLGFEANVSYRYVVDKNRRYLRQEEELSIISYKNILQGHVVGVSLSGRYKPIKPLTIRFTTDFWAVRIQDPDITNGEVVITPGSITNLDFYLNLGKAWRFQFRNYYSPKYQLQQGYMFPKYVMALGVSKGFFKNQLRIRLHVSDVTNTLRSYFRTNESQVDYYFLGNWDWETRVFYVGLNWDFGTEYKGKQKRRGKSDESGGSSVPGGL